MGEHHQQDLGQQFLLEAELALRWRVSVRTLQRWRQNGSGPDCLKLGGRVLYAREHVLAFEAKARPGCGEGPE